MLDRKIKEEEIMHMTMQAIDMNGEKEKIQFALELAIFEVSKRARQGQDDDGDADETKAQARKTALKKGHLGTNLLIKLPYIIGTPEYN